MSMPLRDHRRHMSYFQTVCSMAFISIGSCLLCQGIRTELKPENLSFTAIAKKVGERWQDLPAEEKEPYESEASTAKEKYHSEMADYKTTKSYREYQQYLTEFKAKNNTSSGTPAGAHAESLSGANLRTEGKRPRLAHEETQESMTSGGSVAGDPIEGFDSLSGTKGSRCHRVNSLDSSGPCSTTSGFPSPSSVVSGPAAFRTAVAPFIPLGTASPTSTSSSTPSIHKEPSIGPPIRHSVDSYPEHTSPRSGQRLPPISQFDSRERGQSTTPGPYQGTLGPRLSVERTSPLDQPRRSNRIPSAFKQSHASDTSSRSSMNSSLSGASTAPSSLFSSVVVDEGKRTALSLPPLAAVTAASSLSGSASYATSGRQKVDPLTTHKAPSSAAEQSSQSPFQTSSSTGMKFESLQLPLPHNIAFGQRPLPRPEHEGKLANIFDLQDIPRERNSLKNMTLEQQRFASVTPPDLPGPPQPRHPPHRPALPTLDRSSRRNSQENVLQPNADPLSVLAYAGRLVGRNSHPPPSQ